MAEAESLTIDELAARTGLSVRNIRSHISRGLLPDPELRGRTAYYDQRHVERLGLIAALQDEGLNLAVVARLIKETEPMSGPEATRFYHSVLSAWMGEGTREMTDEELTEALGAPIPARIRQQLVAAGFIEVIPGASRVRVANPPLFQALASAVRAGVGIGDVIAVQLGMPDHIDAIAGLFVDVFTKTLRQRHPQPARSDAELAAMRRLVDELRPHASAAVLANFHGAMVHSMRNAVEQMVSADRHR